MTDRQRHSISLPDGIWWLILRKLDFRSKLQCERVSKQLYGLLKGPRLWPEYDLTLEQLVEADHNNTPFHEIKTPAARCAAVLHILAAMY